MRQQANVKAPTRQSKGENAPNAISQLHGVGSLCQKCT
jgi:hypothetical protein